MTTAEQIFNLHLVGSAEYKQACELMYTCKSTVKIDDKRYDKYTFLDYSVINIPVK